MAGDSTAKIWWQKSQYAYRSGQWGVDHKDYRTAINRFFFAALHGMTAHLMGDGVETDFSTRVVQKFYKRYAGSAGPQRSLLEDYAVLQRLRYRAEYDVLREPTLYDALLCRAIARNMRLVVHNAYPDAFPLD